MIRAFQTSNPKAQEADPLTNLEDHSLRTFIDVLEANEKRCGTNSKATQLLHELMTAVRETSKGGELNINIKIAPDKNDEMALTWKASVKAKIPESEARTALVYHDKDNRAFSKTDPRQLELLAEQEAERAEREARLQEAGVARIGRGEAAATA